MSDRKSYKEILAHEPWRARAGYPHRVDDPGWSPELATPCESTTIQWEAGATGYWCCRDCGYISNTANTQHRRVLRPTQFHDKAVDYFNGTRGTGHDQQDTANRRLFVLTVALLKTARMSDEELLRWSNSP